jgi:hypothetical protein
MTLDLNPFSCFLLPPSHSIVAEPSVFSFPCGAQIMESEVIPHLLPYEEEKPKIIAVSRPPPPPPLPAAPRDLLGRGEGRRN